ncbi:hypothetical protein A2335_00355 [Candidatus Peregrinibacteria bacterium RIFOXYB2_FULL_32_7]|nr:MAG: hypothetical protein A2335_00355 [Candidatus Peregrinibacteria bacterium RIFOXYB2_FULL_32_7]
MKRTIQIVLLVAMLSISMLAIGCQEQDEDVAKRKMSPSKEEVSTNDVDATTEEKTPGGDKF